MKKKFIPESINIDQLALELSESDKESLKSFISRKNIKSKLIDEKIQSSTSQVKRVKKTARIPSSMKKPKKTSLSSNNKNKENQPVNPDRNLNKIINNLRNKKYTKNYSLLKLPFQRLVKNLTEKIQQEKGGFLDTDNKVRYTKKALELLHYSTECHMIDLISDSYLCTNHAKRVTLMNRDFFLARRIRGNKQLTNLIKIKKFNRLNFSDYP